MSISPAPLVTESFEAQLDDLLMRICIELQLDETRYKLAETHYQTVGKWLETEGSPVAVLKPIIYSQGIQDHVAEASTAVLISVWDERLKMFLQAPGPRIFFHRTGQAVSSEGSGS